MTTPKAWLSVVIGLPLAIGVGFAMANVRAGLLPAPLAIGCFVLIVAFVAARSWSQAWFNKHHPDKQWLARLTDLLWLLALAFTVFWLVVPAMIARRL